MRILYALPATGNGHISRAISLYPNLSKLGQVDFLISGSNSHLNFPYKIRFRFNGISLFYNENGGLDYHKLIKSIRFRNLYDDLHVIRPKNYDLIISDFEPISALSCKLAGVPFLHWGHQASFYYPEVPRPKKLISLGKIILENFVSSPLSYGLHFKAYNDNISTSVVKNTIYYSDRIDEEHITVYLQQFTLQQIYLYLKRITEYTIQIFHPEIKYVYSIHNLQFFPINKLTFDESLIHCRLLITGAGFETPSEAMHLNKRIICMPIQSHYEQQCNAMALDQLGIPVLSRLNQLTKDLIFKEFNKFGLTEYRFKASTSEEVFFSAIGYWEKNYKKVELPEFESYNLEFSDY